VKVDLGLELVTRFHSAAAAQQALDDFEARFKQGAMPDEMPEMNLAGAPLGIVAALKQSGLVPSSAEAIRNIEQGGVRIDGEKVVDRQVSLSAGTYVLQVGKRKFARVTLS
jgi:tyrosyl-tRNA synthetase